MTKQKREKWERYVERKASVGDAISEAMSELQGLAEECREVFDNMPESLQSSARGDALSSSADALESIDEPEVTEDADGEVTWSEFRGARRGRGLSRASRRDNAVVILGACKERVEEIAQEIRDDWETGPEQERADNRADELEELIDALDSAISDAEGCEFPSMRG